MNLFERLYLCQFPEDPHKKLRNLARQYIKETEAYDQTVCTYRNKNGIALPNTPSEFALVNNNAHQLFNKLFGQLDRKLALEIIKEERRAD